MNKYSVKYENGNKVTVFANTPKAAYIKAEKYGKIVSVNYSAKRMAF